MEHVTHVASGCAGLADGGILCRAEVVTRRVVELRHQQVHLTQHRQDCPRQTGDRLFTSDNNDAA